MIATIVRLYDNVIKQKLKESIRGKIGEDQAGFTAGRSCVKSISTHYEN